MYVLCIHKAVKLKMSVNSGWMFYNSRQQRPRFVWSFYYFDITNPTCWVGGKYSTESGKNCWLSAHFNFFETLLFKSICLKGFFINTRDQRDRSQKWVKFGIINNPHNSLCPDLQYVSICDLKSSTLIKLCYHAENNDEGLTFNPQIIEMGF